MTANVDTARLDDLARELYCDADLARMLRALLTYSCGFLDSVAGSVALLHADREHYVKVGELGPARSTCLLGESFSLAGGAAGLIIRRRAPIMHLSYDDIQGGHLPASHPASRGSVMGVPIWWRGEVIGATTIFAGHHRRFSVAEIDHLETLTQLAAPGIVRATELDSRLAHASLRHELVAPRRHPEPPGARAEF